MTPKREMQIAYILIIVLLFVGVISYAAFPAKTPDEPIRLMYKTVAGKVLFDHKTHTDIAGYAISCGDCHHTLAKDEYADAQSCSECHVRKEGRIANLTGFYMPGRDLNRWVNTIGWIAVLGALFGVTIHGLGRVFMRGNGRKEN